ncbi:ImmA/IrrE family metallo-endopeptidase [Clostridium paraputrificum]|uniref:ImmA/IrrE family metallo-endopeptidase n=1 Tax=Clostridium TaxID=1485 RepID=UPI00189FF13F|nr:MULTISPECIES: ImmA/IrrE family metallo-endopeptidase [Clostridium]MBS7129995.1 ImmA/IrrE family metallo-endopeptidase [Clostridium sp.]MDB2074259.1 ImmA/IrrE family metallo-endopeptidase [Clostridium paraputrificum]MDB2077888.1 ImmA/IrrE family metallo-endopeptidase [Clostridium paraputrificum]MDB2098112.1 ImmA/IrrE family metallo-endopeptidase [Clostridium paraputrificum]MDU6808915.1 ImmA/IrrE family metallo-endopeptidase [Clostridium sp.]
MTYDELLIEADKLGVIVKEATLRTVDGKCYGNRIAIDSSLSEREKACVLAEELSHYKLSVGNISDQSNSNNRKQELLARKDCYEKLITPECIIKAILSGTDNIYELSEILSVPESFLLDTIKHYRKKYGIYYVGKTHLLTFEPLNVIDFQPIRQAK